MTENNKATFGLLLDCWMIRLSIYEQRELWNIQSGYKLGLIYIRQIQTRSRKAIAFYPRLSFEGLGFG